MGVPVLKEARRHARRPLLGELTGHLVYMNGRLVPCLAVDVSSAGLRILAREELTPGVATFLSISGYNLALVVVWCQPDSQRHGSYACGLMSTGDVDIELFIQFIDGLDGNSHGHEKPIARKLKVVATTK